MPKQLRVSITKPCHEDWNNMSPTEQGAFCQSCQKNVIDFSLKTENEIYEILTNSKEHVCGRFTTFQLEQPVRKTELKNGFMNWRAVAAAVVSFFSLSKLLAGDLETRPKQFTYAPNAQPAMKADSTSEKAVVNTDAFVVSKRKDSVSICGKVIDAKTSAPIPWVAIAVRYTSIVAFTDSSGNFSLKIPVDSIDRIEFSNMYYISQDFHINEFVLNPNRTVKLTENKKMFMFGWTGYIEEPVKKDNNRLEWFPPYNRLKRFAG